MAKVGEERMGGLEEEKEVEEQVLRCSEFQTEAVAYHPCPWDTVSPPGAGMLVLEDFGLSKFQEVKTETETRDRRMALAWLSLT